ncbi:ankyrin repeat domain-containing protein [Chloropicon primus]|uniref:Uncharacterized protein n=1 Tax=Chloropicon primus TaxID=1764295 RepID=A0A5B8MUT3_9CHLO|nr:hypothetical protein A3770_10p57700 [Chloropicon primus]UPR02464.1 ankyrin repeat domain-containing protein [Chloropicon primus]|eukprot:QDZ23252.1 hypothetical protein A3770_10p57700 [Chloropicon primus]
MAASDAAASLRELVIQESTEFLAKELKARPGSLNAKIGMMEQSLLHEAAEKNKVESLNTLIKMGANMNAQDKDRGTPLHYCSLRGHLEVAQTLLAKGAYVDKQDADGNLAHHWAAGNSKLGVLELLLDHCDAKILLSKANKAGDTVLHAAARGDTRECIKLLVKRGAKVDAKNNKGDTPLHVAASSGKQVCVEELLRFQGTKEVTANSEDKLPQDVAVSSAIRALIEEHLKSPVSPEDSEEEATPPSEEGGDADQASVEEGVEQVTRTLSGEKLLGDDEAPGVLQAGGALSPQPLTKAEKREAMSHMSSSARDKLNPKSGQQKFLEKYNLASNKDPKMNSLLKSEG